MAGVSGVSASAWALLASCVLWAPGGPPTGWQPTSRPDGPVAVLMAMDDLPSKMQPIAYSQPATQVSELTPPSAARETYYLFSDQAAPLLSEVFLLGDETRIAALREVAEQLIELVDQARTALGEESPAIEAELGNWRLLAEGMAAIAASGKDSQALALAEQLAQADRWPAVEMRELALLLAGRIYRQADQPARTVELIGTTGPERRRWRPVRLALQLEVMRALADEDQLPLAILLTRRLEETCGQWLPRSLRTPAANAAAWLRRDLVRRQAEVLEAAGETQAAADRRKQLEDWTFEHRSEQVLPVLRFGRLFDPPDWLPAPPVTTAPAEGEGVQADAGEEEAGDD
jgi:hypothetical protein